MVINGTNPGLWSVFHIEALWTGNILTSYPQIRDYNYLPPPHCYFHGKTLGQIMLTFIQNIQAHLMLFCCKNSKSNWIEWTGKTWKTLIIFIFWCKNTPNKRWWTCFMIFRRPLPWQKREGRVFRYGDCVSGWNEIVWTNVMYSLLLRTQQEGRS